MKTAIVILLSVVAFVVTAKLHGRQLRLEREHAGYMTVSFGGANPPFVQALWRAERVRFWLTTVALAAAVLVVRRAGLPGLRPWGVVALAAVLWAPSVSFVALGALSAARVARAEPGSGR